MMCVGRGWWNGLHQLWISHSRKEEIQELAFSSQLTNRCFACCWGPWISLSCTSSGSSFLYVYWVGKAWTCHKELNIHCGLEELKAVFFKSTLSIMCEFALCPLKLSRPSSVCPFWPWPWSLREGLVMPVLFSSPLTLSLACSPGFGERGIAADNLQVWFISWILGGPNEVWGAYFLR